MDEAVAVVGGGSWGTTLAVLASRAGRAATLLVRDPEAARRLTEERRNARYLPDLVLPGRLRVTADPEVACRHAALCLLAVPTTAVRERARSLRPLLGRATVVSAAKGLERGTLARMTEVVVQELGEAARPRVGALSGPNLAREIAAGKPAATVIAGIDGDRVRRAGSLLQSPAFRVYANDDVVGVEMGGALKNVIAIGAGIGDGLGAGDNAKAAFLTRGLAEIARLGVASGAHPLTFAGLAGLGDLVATCESPLSRNRTLGQLLAEGKRLPEIQASLGQVTEGVETTRAARALGERAGVELPITSELHDVLFAGKSPRAAIGALMAREAKDERAGLFGIPLSGAEPGG